jgi:RNA polymerase sigma-70 factor (ECF subfamily)
VKTARASEQVVRALFDEHGAALLGFATRLTGGDREHAEDVVQETLLRAWRHPEALVEQRGDVRPWLFTVARNVAIDAHRRRQSRVVEVGDAALALVPEPRDDIEHALEHWLVSDALASLSPPHREVLVETFLRDRSVAQAAATLAVPVGTVKSRTHYALQALRLALQERGVAP